MALKLFILDNLETKGVRVPKEHLDELEMRWQGIVSLKQETEAALLDDHDIALRNIPAPTLPIIAPNIGEAFADLNGEQVDLINQIIRFTGLSNLTGLPALTVPCGLKSGMPVGLQIIGPALQEGLVLNVGYAVEQTNPLQGKKPELGRV